MHLLRRRYGCNYITVEQLLADHLPHLGSLDALRRAIRKGRIDIQISRLDNSRNARRIVYLHSLADFLDRAEKTAATAAA
ncbi:pyocin activator PrtN family protein [Azorhizophilus paspali]|uniref:pyocin activator PrtN family protein n=1 Tax=Azorhizophilus paspali TaxID=69963 RepID=UPI0036284906